MANIRVVFNPSTIEFDESKFSVGEFDYKASDVQKIKLDWVAGDVTIKESSNKNLYVRETNSESHYNRKLRYYIHDGIMEIKFCKYGFASSSIGSKDLEIEVPALSELNINVVSSDVKFPKTSAKKITFDSVSGNLSAEIESGVKKIVADTVSGNIDLTFNDSQFVDVFFETISGNKKSKYSGTGPSKVDVIVNTVSGNLILK